MCKAHRPEASLSDYKCVHQLSECVNLAVLRCELSSAHYSLFEGMDGGLKVPCNRHRSLVCFVRCQVAWLCTVQIAQKISNVCCCTVCVYCQCSWFVSQHKVAHV